MKLPRKLDDFVDSGRHSLDSLVDGGRHGLDSFVDGGRKSAHRLYSGGRHWIEDHLPEPRSNSGPRSAPEPADVRRSAERVVARTRQATDERLRAPVRWIEERLLPEPRRTASILLPSVVAAATAGAAFWWWTSWSRGRAEAADRAALDAAGGAEGKAHPERVMAHAPEPTHSPAAPADASAARLATPAEDVMAHAPPPPEVDPARAAAQVAAGLAAGVGEVAPGQAVASLDESLAVQGGAAKDGAPA